MDLRILTGSPLKKLSFSPLGKKDKSTISPVKTNAKTDKSLGNGFGFGLLSKQGSERRRWFHKGSRSLGKYLLYRSKIYYSVIILWL